VLINFYTFHSLDLSFLFVLGNDVGALTKEFFWKSLTAMYEEPFEGRIALFEGRIDHFLPTTDISLLHLKVFRYVGSFMAYAGLHAGISFIGLSEAVVEYLFLEDETDVPIKMTLEDIVEDGLRNTIQQVGQCRY